MLISPNLAHNSDMADEKFTVEWNQADYASAYKKVFVPSWRKDNTRHIIVGTFQSAALMLLIAGTIGGIVWLLTFNGMSFWLAVLIAYLIALGGVFYNSYDVSKQVTQGWQMMQQVGEVTYEITDIALVIRFSSGSTYSVPWTTMRLKAENEFGMLIYRVDNPTPILLPNSIGEARLSQIREHIAASAPRE